MTFLSETTTSFPFEMSRSKIEVSSTPSFSGLLSQARGARKNYQEESRQISLAQFHNDFFVHFSALYQHLSSYVNCLKHLHIEASNDSTSVTSKCPKTLVLETRAALRFGLTCLSLGNPQQDDDCIRQTVQKEAVAVSRIHHALADILSQPRGDTKCRTLSAQFLSNLVTCNTETASVVAEDFAMCPSKEIVTSRIMGSLSETSKLSDMDLNWVDMMLTSVKAGNRESLAATVAALHNCLASFQNSFASLDDKCTKTGLDRRAEAFALKVASNSMLMSTLVRQILSVDYIKASLADESASKDVAAESCGDSATEWIVLLIEKLCRFGLLSEMFASVGGERKTSTSCDSLVTPEHVVLLHCVERVVDDALHASTSISQSHPLGGDGKEDAILSSNLFLARQSSAIRSSLLEKDGAPSASDGSERDFHCRGVAYLAILEILASSLGVESIASVAHSRAYLGSETELLSEVAHHLGKVVDELTVKNSGRKARELVMSDEDKRLIVVLVRVLGNLCFQCRQNQDLMRFTIVPFSEDICNMGGDTVASQAPEFLERTALHVLLSCTSFSYGCFTLREWAIVAVRNVLDANEDNQKLVEQLEAQQPVNTPELQRMGVRVDIDRRGQVSVVPEHETDRRAERDDEEP